MTYAIKTTGPMTMRTTVGMRDLTNPAIHTGAKIKLYTQIVRCHRMFGVVLDLYLPPDDAYSTTTLVSDKR